MTAPDLDATIAEIVDTATVINAAFDRMLADEDARHAALVAALGGVA